MPSPSCQLLTEPFCAFTTVPAPAPFHAWFEVMALTVRVAPPIACRPPEPACVWSAVCSVAFRFVAVAFDDRADHGGGDEHLQQRQPGRAQLFLDDRQLGQAGAAAAVLGGDRRTHEAVLGECLPELVRGAVGGDDLGEVAMAEALGDVAHRLADQPVLVGLDQGQGRVGGKLAHQAKLLPGWRPNSCREC